MKAVKKIILASMVCMVACFSTIVSFAGATGTYYSSWSTLGTAQYRGVADFTGGAYVIGTAGFEVLNCTISGVGVANNVTSVTVSGSLYAPNNLGVPVTKTIAP